MNQDDIDALVKVGMLRLRDYRNGIYVYELTPFGRVVADRWRDDETSGQADEGQTERDRGYCSNGARRMGSTPPPK